MSNIARYAAKVGSHHVTDEGGKWVRHEDHLAEMDLMDKLLTAAQEHILREQTIFAQVVEEKKRLIARLAEMAKLRDEMRTDRNKFRDQLDRTEKTLSDVRAERAAPPCPPAPLNPMAYGLKLGRFLKCRVIMSGDTGYHHVLIIEADDERRPFGSDPRPIKVDL